MIEKLTKSYLRQVLDKLQLPTTMDDDGNYHVVLDADEDFDHDVIINFMLDENDGWFKILGFARDFGVDQANMTKAILTCNQYNVDSALPAPTAFVSIENDAIMLRRCFYIDKPVSEEFLINEIKFTIGSIWNFFKNFNGE